MDYMVKWKWLDGIEHIAFCEAKRSAVYLAEIISTNEHSGYEIHTYEYMRGLLTGEWVEFNWRLVT